MTDRYVTAGGVVVHRTVESIAIHGAIEPIVDALDAQRGVLLASSYEYPGRYTRWDMGFVDPPLAFVARGREFRITALNARGRVLLAPVAAAIAVLPAATSVARTADDVHGRVLTPTERVPEELRSRQPSVFSVLRALVELFGSREDPHLGLYGAFGYDLALQFEPLRVRLARPEGQRDLVLYLADEIVIVDHRRELATRRRYDFEAAGATTVGVPRDGTRESYVAPAGAAPSGDHAPGEYASNVRLAREAFHRGDLFE